jgi:excisionase family DNA binding protein
MNASFLTSLSESEFKEFLKTAIREILQEDLRQINSSLPDILNIEEAASFLKLKITTLYEKTSRKLIPHFKKGNKLYFNRAELLDWIQNGKVKTQSEITDDASTYLLMDKSKKHRK